MLNKIIRLYRRLRLERARVKNRDLYSAVANARAQVKDYNDNPQIAAIMQSFNKKENIGDIFGALATASIDEMIFIDDGSVDDSITEFVSLARGKNHFVIRCNDIFEVRSYDRAIDFCRAEFIILLQDDDIPPVGAAWVEEALRCFADDPELAIIGGLAGLNLKLDATSSTGLGYDRVEVSPGGTMKYVQVVNRAPMFLRKSSWKSLGGIDQEFAPFQCDDVDICLRAWKAGLKVGLIHSDFIRDVGTGGMRLFNADKVSGQATKNWKKIFDRYGELIETGYFTDKVAAASAQTARR